MTFKYLLFYFYCLLKLSHCCVTGCDSGMDIINAYSFIILRCFYVMLNYKLRNFMAFLWFLVCGRHRRFECVTIMVFFFFFGQGMNFYY